MKIQALDVKKLRKRSILVIRRLLKQYNVNYSIVDDKEKLLRKIAEIQYYASKIKIYSRYDCTI